MTKRISNCYAFVNKNNKYKFDKFSIMNDLKNSLRKKNDIKRIIMSNKDDKIFGIIMHHI